MANRKLTTPKASATFEPQTECDYFHENRQSYECSALIQCFCTLEQKPCPFYRGRKAQTEHEGFYATDKHSHGRKKILPKATMMAMQADFDKGMSWRAISEKFNISMRQITDARCYYNLPFQKIKKNTRTIADADLNWAVRAHEDGMEWDHVAKKLGFTQSAIRVRLRRDADRGIYHR